MKPEFIIIHHTAFSEDVPISTIRGWHLENSYLDVGYHYYIRKSGEIEVGRMEDVTGAHCRDGGMNHKSIGICLSGDFTKQEPTDEQIDSMLKLTRSIQNRYFIKAVLGHRDVEGAKTLCPGFEVKDFFLKETMQSFGI